MTTPIDPPEGYLFFIDDYGNPLFQDPSGYGISDPQSQDAMRVMLLHETCGCPVAWGMLAVHDAWHVALGA
jgi:hypothetical protein